MSVSAVIVEASSVRVWGLTPVDRLGRALARRGVSISDPGKLPAATDSVLVIRGDHVFDDRVLAELLAKREVAFRRTDAPADPIVAAHVPAARTEEAIQWVREGVIDPKPPIEIRSPWEVATAARLQLRKSQAAYAILVSEGNRRTVENFLYDASYKSVTDLVTKWAWPVPARWAVHGCVRLGLRPNHVTGFGFLLMLAALGLFTQGAYAAGLMAGWLMTFLDTVDGKLARTTLTSSRFGHYLDKVTDLIHPPFWYLAWAKALPEYSSPTPDISLDTVIWAIFAFYLVGRIAEGVCSRCFVAGGMFVWRPIDSYFRLVTARRNTCLILLTFAAAWGRPDLALWLVAAWTVVTTTFLTARLASAWATWRHGDGSKLLSWLIDADASKTDPSLAVRVFAWQPSVRV